MSNRLKTDLEAALERTRDIVATLHRDLGFLDDPDTICTFGDLAFNGDGVEQDYNVAAAWYRIAAEQGHSPAQHNLGLMYDDGQGIYQDYFEAAKWYHLAAEQENRTSQNNLGRLYEMGKGLPQDYFAALEWYRRAAEDGDTDAKANFANLKARIELEKHEKNLDVFCELISTNRPLIGDATLLPKPKEAILYSIAFVLDHNYTKRELATSLELIQALDEAIPIINGLLVCLARDWQVIAFEDKHLIANLAGCDSFPDWAVPLKRKYIDEERANCEASEAIIRVMQDKLDSKEASKTYNTTSENWFEQLTKPELDYWSSKSQPVKEWWYANTKPEQRGQLLRTEIGATASYNEFLHLPETTRLKITQHLKKQADESLIHLRELGFAIPEQTGEDE